ncbi:hypothetical protein HID58_002470, partial [Brassica napus]
YLAWLRSTVLENLSLTVMKRGFQRDSGESIVHVDEIKTSLGRTSIIDIDGFLFFYMLNHIHPYEIVNGVVEFQGVPEEVKTEQKDKDVEEKGVLAWLIPLNNKEISDKDLRFQDTLLLIEEPKGFKIDFIFEQSPYFKNTILTKTYHMIDEDEHILEKAIQTEIKWYPGKYLTHQILRKSQ